MHTSGESLLIMLLVGLIAGWLAGQLVTGGGFGLIPDIAIGIVGAFDRHRVATAIGHPHWQRDDQYDHCCHDRCGGPSSDCRIFQKGIPTTTPILALATLRRPEVEPRVCPKGGVLTFFGSFVYDATATAPDHDNRSRDSSQGHQPASESVS
jgi:hypothetical protein